MSRLKGKKQLQHQQTENKEEVKKKSRSEWKNTEAYGVGRNINNIANKKIKLGKTN